MSQFSEIKTPTTTEGTLAGLLSFLKTGLNLGGAKGDLFASLLAQTKDSVPQIVAQDPAPAQVNVTSAYQGSSAQANDDPAPAATSAANDGQSVAPVVQDKGKGNAKRAAKDESKEKTAPPAAANANAQAVQNANDKSAVKTVAAAGSKADAAKDADEAANAQEEKIDDETLAEIIAALAPLDVSATKVAATGTDEKAATTQAVGDAVSKEDLAAMIEAELEALMALRKMASAEGSKETTTDATANVNATTESDAKTVLAAMQKIAQSLAAETDETTGDDTVAKALDALEQTQTTAKAETALKGLAGQGAEKTASATTLAPAPAALKAHQDFLDRFLNPENAQTATTALPTTVATGAALQALEQGVAETADNVVQSTGAAKATQTTTLANNGVQPTGSYDFANQLSAARASKGGATGLPQVIEQVAVQLHKIAKDGVDQMTIQLRPAELGKIEIKLSFAADKSVTGTVVADNQATLNMLQKDSAGLQRALQDAGLQADANSLQFSLRDNGQPNQFAQNQTNQNGNGSGSNGLSGFENTESADSLPLNIETYYLTPGRVNLRV